MSIPDEKKGKYAVTLYSSLCYSMYSTGSLANHKSTPEKGRKTAICIYPCSEDKMYQLLIGMD